MSSSELLMVLFMCVGAAVMWWLDEGKLERQRYEEEREREYERECSRRHAEREQL